MKFWIIYKIYFLFQLIRNIKIIQFQKIFIYFLVKLKFKFICNLKKNYEKILFKFDHLKYGETKINIIEKNIIRI
jgi:hypothetical protein